MVDRRQQHRSSITQVEDIQSSRPRWGNVAGERAFLALLDGGAGDGVEAVGCPPATRSAQKSSLTPALQPAALTLAPCNANLYARRHSAHTCPTAEERITPILPPLPLRPPAVPKRMYMPSAAAASDVAKEAEQATATTVGTAPAPQIPPMTRTRPLPPVPPARNPNPNSPSAFTKRIHESKHVSPKAINNNTNNNNNNVKHVDCAFEFGSKLAQEYSRMPPAPAGPPPPTPKTYHKNNSIISQNKANQQNHSHQTGNGKVSIRQDSSVSSDSFSQTSSPSYTTKTMETPLLPPRTPVKHNGVINKMQHHHQHIIEDDDDAANATITKSASTPASLQAIVRFQNGSNMSLHHRIIKDMRRPSSHYVRSVRLKFRFAQVILNAIALLAIGGGMAAYFKAYPLEIHIMNNASAVANTSVVQVLSPVIVFERPMVNPAPGICLPVIVNFCQQHKVPYNFTVFPNFMGHFGQPEAQQELEVYDAVVDVRCYELAALFLCSVFVPKCGPDGVLVRPCRSLCYETKRRCGFFLDVFGLELPDYLLKCEYFPESENPDICVGHDEVKEAKIKASKPVCPSGFQCDVKRCIPKDWQCDGHVDCKDQSDELNCEMCGPGMIHCGADRCMTQEHMCDGKVDCPWAQDERNCLRLSDRNGDEGQGKLEVFRPDQQKWLPACIFQWDQATSPDNICSLLGYSNSNGSWLRDSYDKNIAPPIQETTTIWRMHQKRQKNMLREFGSCRGLNYPTVDINCTNFMCGKTRKTYAERRRAKRIVGGVPSKPGDWPFLAALLGGPEEIFYCAGVLIADQWVLTASHCVGNHSDVSGWTIQLGITRRHAHSYYGQKVKVRRVVPHPMYNLGIAHDNDVALFQLSSRVTFHEHLLPVCLPPANKELHPGTICTVIGWGKKEDTGMSEYEPEVNEVDVPVLNRDLCNAWLENKDLNVTDGMICAGYEKGGKDACQGDSGGPLLCRDDEDPERWFVGGIVSWGIKCAHPHLPGVYAYVPKYIPWILQQMQQYSD